MGTKAAIFLILFTAVLVRFYGVADLGYFMMDEERDAFLVRRMLVDKRPLLVGGSIPGGINVGPAFFYISAIPYYFSRLNPVGPAWAAAVIGVIGVIGVFWVGKELFGKRVGILAAVFAGFSLLNVVYQRPWWPLTMSQVVTLTAYLALFKLCKGPTLPRQGRTLINWLWVLVLALIIGAQSDPSTLSLIPLSIIWLWWYRRRSGLSRKHYLAAAGLFILAHATWFIFELRHDFQSSRVIIGLLKGSTLASAKVEPYDALTGVFSVLKMTAAAVYRLFIPTGPLDVVKQISPAAEFLDARMNGIWWPAAWGMLAVIGYRIFKGLSLPQSKDSPLQKARRLLSLHILISMLGILLYTSLFPGYVHEWMWFFMFPGFFLMAADAALVVSDKVRPWVPRVGPLLIFAWLAWQLSLFLKLENAAGLGEKLQVVQTAQAEIAGKPYELRSEGEGALRYGGWRYLFTLYGDPPVKSYMDYVYQDWVYPKSEVETDVVVHIRNNLENGPDFTISEHSENSESQITPENQRI